MNLEKLKLLAFEKYPEWMRVIDEEPTMWKDYVGRDTNPLVIIIDEMGVSIGYNTVTREPVCRMVWEQLDPYQQGEIFLAEYDEKTTELRRNQEAAILFEKKVLEEIFQHTLDWNLLIRKNHK
ncbi:hypothetical protein [Bacillus toyonensis]|uniref:hypothetical protein n=1 Tax=Bacillus toyonensis TaxID=155322 RepID=UPI002E2108DB|nr:hypothetical protein [Bacillus toyonensis]